MKIAIVGHGFVGKAVDYGFSNAEKTIIDPIYNVTLDDIDLHHDVTFVCVPTPMGDGGKIDCSIVVETVQKLMRCHSGIIVIKSTVTPDVIEELTRSPMSHRVVYNPEFLTEKNATEDFVNPEMHIFGGPRETCIKLKEIYDEYSLCKPCPVHYVSAIDASFIKYGINCFLATKVLWFNQLFDTVENFGGNFSHIINAIGQDSRIGSSHTLVPGFDGKRGYGGACFPKDTSAFANFAKSFSVLEKVIEENNSYRKNYDKDSREMDQNVSYD